MSEDWIKEYMEKLNNYKAYEEAAKTWEGDFHFVVRNAENKIINVGYFDLWHGKCRKAFQEKDLDNLQEKPEFVYDGKLENWKKVLEKKLDPIQGLMTGKFKLIGNMAKVMRAVKAAQELVNTTTQIETEFPE
ncbi:MAG: SCP2 sterol-binding domain-containing protein [Promethearchaeota archaeon]